ncbi:MAG TPA: polysaccharide deacetylase family protein [Candidatus Saccharimonadales bacterium]|nr:polysaccharide deacetylase family protein [Candidatus Saccharimonadales bacterium]
MMAVVLLLIAFSIIALRSPGLTEITTGRKTNVSKATFLKNYTVHYPIFHDAALDAIISRHTEEYIAHFEKRLAGKNDIRDHLTVNYEANHVGTITTSITFISKETVSGQPDVISSQHLVLDMQNKKQLTAQDVIAQNLSARQTLAKLLHDYFKQAGVVSSPLELVNLLELQLADLHDFSLDAHSLILYLNPHQPSITNAGLAPVAIDKSLLGGVLYDTYTKPDSDVQPADPLVASYHIQSPPPAGNIINPDGRMLALTFDDGPDNLTPSVLDRLDTYQSHATFFVLGHLVDTYKATLQRAIREGSEIGNHSWNHPDLRSLSPAELEWQVGATQAAIQVATGGYTPRLMRPPYGGTNSLVAHYLETHGLRQALWNVDTDDWRDRDAEVIYNRIMANAADGRIILLHDIHPTSVQAALRAIRDLKAQGFQLVTASDLYRYRGM